MSCAKLVCLFKLKMVTAVKMLVIKIVKKITHYSAGTGLGGREEKENNKEAL